MIDKKSKDASSNNQVHLTEEFDKPDSSGLSLRTRTISSSTPTTLRFSMEQSNVTAPTSVQSTCSTTTTPGPRPRGRPPRKKKLNHLANKNVLLQTTSKQVESAACSLERLQQEQNKINKWNGNRDINHDQENSDKNIDTKSLESDKNLILEPDINKDEDCIIVDDTCKNKYNARKRKQSSVADVICKKRLLVSNNLRNSLVKESNSTENSSLPSKSNVGVQFSFLAGRNNRERDPQFTDKGSSSFLYGQTYWSSNWEYSASALTGHVQKKASKDSLRKIRLLCSERTTTKISSTLPPPLKSISTLNKYQTSVVQRRGTASKYTQPPIEVSSSLKQNPSVPPVTARRPGRPPGRKNKVLQSVIKSNSPRKSPRQHASTLAAILSGKSIGGNDKLVAQQTGQLINIDVGSNKNSPDMDGPCILTMAVPKHELKPGFRLKHRRQLDHQHDIIKRRRRRRLRSITPPPPKLCAQQPTPQHISVNDSVVDQETVKLRTKHVDVVRRRTRDERLRAAFVCQQLHRVQEIAEQNRRNLAEEDLLMHDVIEQDFPFIPLERNQNEIWSSLEVENDREPDNMCLQIMYEQTADKKFLCTNLTDETLQLFHQQRELALAERLTNNFYGDTVFSDLGTDMISAANKRKKKRPNMTGWPKEKRRKVIASASSMVIDTLNGDSDVERNEIMLKRRRAAAAKQQKLRRQRIKLEQLQQAFKEKTKDTAVSPALPKRRGRRPGPLKKNKTTRGRRRKTSISSNGTTVGSNTSNTTTEIKEKKFTVRKQRRKRLLSENKTTAPVPASTVEPNTVVKRSCGRPKGSVGRRQRWKLQRSHQNQTSPDQQKENVVLPQTSSGKLKCVISTRNNRMKLLPSSSSSCTSSSLKKAISGNKTKKSAVTYNISSCLESLSSPMTVVGKITRTTAKKKRLQQQQQQQIASTTVTWDAGRPKRYHSANHGRNAAVEEDCCFVGSQPFEQHCPGVGGLSQNTILENQQDQKENTVHVADL